jgi:hypothetical protein
MRGQGGAPRRGGDDVNRDALFLQQSASTQRVTEVRQLASVEERRQPALSPLSTAPTVLTRCNITPPSASMLNTLNYSSPPRDPSASMLNTRDYRSAPREPSTFSVHTHNDTRPPTPRSDEDTETPEGLGLSPTHSPQTSNEGHGSQEVFYGNPYMG